MPALWRTLVARLAGGEDLVLVTVARTDGSVPREVGAAMLVGAGDIVGTIGGGHLEWEAAETARTLLDGGPARQLQKQNLAARLGQCCGGVVWLVYERIRASALADWLPLAAALDSGHGCVRRVSRGRASAWTTDDTAAPADAGVLIAGEEWHFSQFLPPAAAPLLLFGAGHVGEALVRVLAPTGWPLHWIDTREQMPAFEHPWPAGVKIESTDAPEECIAAAPGGAWYLVMTHRHDLDLLLAEHILARADFAYFGMIGSRSKRASFVRRLAQRGLDATDMICPVGVPGIHAKDPASIAIAIAAQLLLRREPAATREEA
ncbi:xanthine dehydrogenase accessory protein XdhC [Paludibacterium yongneupense]|uniref:xanthine dehydrogenase accessory protein XdhC n=1 Tax=Paludibacterium yongneupense TaxID=400061 RepID=UPI00041D54FF|nr:xanthine dehydrogenase accessory protein XdhC [Paludibacterium yongneupense]